MCHEHWLITGVFLSVINSGLFMSDQNLPSIPYKNKSRTGLVYLRLWTLIRTELKLVWQRYWFSSHLLRWIRTCLLLFGLFVTPDLSLIGRVMWPKLSGSSCHASPVLKQVCVCFLYPVLRNQCDLYRDWLLSYSSCQCIFNDLSPKLLIKSKVPRMSGQTPPVFERSYDIC